jgi:nucleoside-diphosphate-sugar epimerase
MKIFVTGGSGYIGNSVARAFRRAGHEVSALVRNEEKAKRVWSDELRPVLGDLRSPESWAKEAQAADVIVHCAAEMSKDFADLDKSSTERLIAYSKEGNRQRTFIYTSGVWVYGNTGLNRVNESSPLTPFAMVSWRPAVEELALRASSERLLTAVVRPGCVYGGRGSLTSSWFESAEKEGAARIVGDGKNRWAMIHVEDLADAYVRLAHARVRGEVLNVTDRSRYTVGEMAAAATRATGRGADFKTWPVAEAAKVMGPFAEALALDQHVDSWKAVQLLNWNPRFGGFVDDAELYFQAWKNWKNR